MLALLHGVPLLCAAFAAFGAVNGEADDDDAVVARRSRIARVCALVAASAWLVAAGFDAATWSTMSTMRRVFDGALLVVGAAAIALIVLARRHTGTLSER